jgi:hypothetical protein
MACLRARASIAPYRFHWIKVVSAKGKTLHATGAGEPMKFRIRRDRFGREYVTLTLADPVFGPVKFKTLPFKGEEK